MRSGAGGIHLDAGQSDCHAFVSVSVALHRAPVSDVIWRRWVLPEASAMWSAPKLAR